MAYSATAAIAIGESIQRVRWQQSSNLPGRGVPLLRTKQIQVNYPCGHEDVDEIELVVECKMVMSVAYAAIKQDFELQE